MTTPARTFRRGMVALAALAMLFVLSVPSLTSAGASPLGLTAASPCGTPPASQRQHPATYKHVIWIIFENKSISDIIGDTKDAPYLNSLANQCGNATKYYAITHKSFQNYVAQLCGCGGINSRSVTSQGIRWKVYAEGMNSACYKHTNALYLRDHNPTTYFTTVSAADCDANDVPMDKVRDHYTTCPGSNGVPINDNFYDGNFRTAINNNALPQLSVVVPSQAHNMKGCYVWSAQIKHADNWLKNVMAAIVSTPDYQNGQTTVFITWDEGWPVTNVGEQCLNTLSEDCHIPTMVVSPYVGNTALGQVHNSATLVSHYSLLKATEQMLGVGTYLGHAGGATSLRSAFNI